nr:Gag-Pol polyprotein [Tanacetum cinerariifolium]
MIGNKSYLTDYKEIDGGFVAFGGNSKKGKITGKDFKLTDESHVLLKVSRKDNIYSVDLNNVVPQGGLTCLFTKATSEESNLWHMRLGQFCEMKGIKREFSFARTPQQNGVAERKNRTLIEAVRTMLADSKLTTTLWAEAVLVMSKIRSGPNRLFDIDALTKSMNYKPIVAGNQSNGSAGTKACDNVGKTRVETVSDKDYILLPLWTQDLPFSSCSKDSYGAGFKPSGEEEKKDAEDQWNKDSEVPSTAEPIVDQEEKDSVNNTNRVSDVSSTVNTANNEVNAVEADLNNMESTFQVSPIPITRIHKDHPLEQVIGDLQSALQTRRMSKSLEGYGLVSTVKQRTNHKDLQNCLFACFFITNETQKGIDYDEVFAPVSRIEAIRLFLAYASFKDFVVYQMDVKSAFLYEKIEKEVYFCQPSGFEDPDFPDKVYKVEKALYGLHQAPRTWTASEAEERWDFHCNTSKIW